MIVPLDAVRPNGHIFIYLDKTPECDGRTGSRWLLQRCALREMGTHCKNL